MREKYIIPFVFSIMAYGVGVKLYIETLFSNELFWLDTFIYSTPPWFAVHLVLLRFLIPLFTEILLKIINKIYLIIYIIFILNFYFVLPSFNTQNESIPTSLYLMSHILWLVPMIGWIMTNKLKTLKDEEEI
jgi:formate hydrogenlyase subunit 4